MGLYVRRRTCGHGTTSTEHGPAGRCERCDLTAKLVMRLRQASAIAELLGYPSVRDELIAIAEAPAVHDRRLAEVQRPKMPKPVDLARAIAAAPRAAAPLSPIAPTLPPVAPPPDMSRPPEAYESIGDDNRAWWGPNRW